MWLCNFGLTNLTKNLNKINLKKELFHSSIDFLRLEKVEIGGVKGKAFSARVFKIFEEYKDEFEKFSNKKYEPLDPDGKVFIYYLKKKTI